MRRVAVTGLGIVSPLGNEPGLFFDALAAGRSGIARLPDGIHPRLRMRIVAASDFDGSQHFSTAQLRVLDRVSQFAVYASRQAVADAGLALDEHEKARSGVFLGTGMGGAQSTDDAYESLYQQASDRVKPLTVLMAMTNAAASWVGIEHGLAGPECDLHDRMLVVLGRVRRSLAEDRVGRADVMLAGGSEAPLNFGTLKAWDAMKTLATEDADSRGIVQALRARSQRAWCWAKARPCWCSKTGSRPCGATHASAASSSATASARIPAISPDPSFEGQSRAMRPRARERGARARDIDYINAHGTATLANDAVETAAIKAVFGGAAYRIPVSSTKSMHGHLLGAAGALELVACLLALEKGSCRPPAICASRDPECDLDYVAEGARTNARFAHCNVELVCVWGHQCGTHLPTRLSLRSSKPNDDRSRFFLSFSL